jgi:transposase
MKQTRRKFDSVFKAKVSLEAIRERETLSSLAVKYDIHPTQISQWKQEFLEKSAVLFDQKLPSASSLSEVDIEKLYAKIGELQMERDFLKKSLSKLGVM